MTGHPMLEALHAKAADARLAGKLSLYGQFVGSWELDIEHQPLDGSRHQAPGEWHFAWVLGGAAIQDVWIFPSRSFRVDKPAEPWHRYGSTVRWYDPTIEAWHITYFDPAHAFAIHQIGRAAGQDIVQVQAGGDNGVLRRWRFTDITKDRFRWIGDASWDRGATWTFELEMKARRKA